MTENKPKRCTCDDFCDSPCPEHGFGLMDCFCGALLVAPLNAQDLMVVKCHVCGTEYHGHDDNAHGYWTTDPKLVGKIPERYPDFQVRPLDKTNN